ncbi:DinB family protein [soil metagenome]
MMKEILLEQFTVTFDENGWFVALKNALDGLSVEDALWKEGELDHSIWELVVHLRYWNERWLRRFSGGEVGESKETIDATFRGESGGAEEWEKLKDELFQVFADWKRAIETVDEAKFSEQVSDDYDEPWSVPIAHQNIHNAYHIGQIVVIRKIQGSWNAKQGVS